LDIIEPEIAPFDPSTPKTLAWSGSDAPFARYSPLNYTVTLKLGFRSLKVIESGTIRSADPENLTYRSKHHGEWQNVCEVVAIFVYRRWPSAAPILDFIEPQISPFDPPTLKTLA